LEYAKFILEKTKKDYNLIANEFSETRKGIWEELLFIFDGLKKGERVLDLGCGNGRWYKVFKEKGVEYFGIDNSERLIDIAKKDFPEANFFVADALNLPFNDGFFDKIFSIAFLHHIPSFKLRIDSLKETKRVLKENGILILTCWKIHRFREIFILFKYTLLKLVGMSRLDFKDIFLPWGKKTLRYYHCFSKKELENLVERVGFEILESGVIKNKKGNRQNYYLICQKVR